MTDTPEVAVARYAARISLWALAFSAGSLVVAGGLFALEMRRWFDEGVRLSMSVMVDAELYGGVQKDDKTYLAVTVTNRGSAPTTLTHMVLYNYPSRFARWLPRYLLRWAKSQRVQTFIVTNPVTGQLPHVLEPGRNWHGMATSTPELEQMIEAKRLYVGIVGSHSEATLFRHVLRWKPPKNSKTA